MLICQRVTVGNCSAFGAWRYGSAPDAGDEIAKVVAEQHDDPVILRNMIPPDLFLGSPTRPFTCKCHIVIDGRNPRFNQILNSNLFLYTGTVRCRVAVSIRQKKHAYTGSSCEFHEFRCARYRCRHMRRVPVIKLFGCKWRFVTKLKIDTVNQRLIDIHDDCRRQIFCIGLVRNRAPRFIGDQSRQCKRRRAVYLRGDRTIFATTSASSMEAWRTTRIRSTASGN